MNCKEGLLLSSGAAVVISMVACGGDSSTSVTTETFSPLSSSSQASVCEIENGVTENSTWETSLSANVYIKKEVCERTNNYLSYYGSMKCVDVEYDEGNNRLAVKFDDGGSTRWGYIKFSECNYKLFADGFYHAALSDIGIWSASSCLCKIENGTRYFRTSNEENSSDEFSSSSSSVYSSSSVNSSSSAKSSSSSSLWQDEDVTVRSEYSSSSIEYAMDVYSSSSALSSSSERSSSSGKSSSSVMSSSSEKGYSCGVATYCSTCVDNSVYDAENNTLTDLRDNQVYKTTVIGTQTWMAQNLNVDYDDCYGQSSFCYDDSEENCAVYGHLYLWRAAMDAVGIYGTDGYSSDRGACPKGWHVPSDDEWQTLSDYVDSNNGSEAIGTSLKSDSLWMYSGNGTDMFGFAGLPAGHIEGSDSDRLGYHVDFWSSTEVNTYKAYGWTLDYSASEFARVSDNEEMAFSVRCLKDNE